jgi:hypothetical protein
MHEVTFHSSSRADEDFTNPERGDADLTAAWSWGDTLLVCGPSNLALPA